MILRRLGTAAAIGFVGGALLLASPVNAEGSYYPDAGWQVLDTGTPTGVWAPDAGQVSSVLSGITGSAAAELTWAAGDLASNLGTSVETSNLGLAVEADAVVSFRYVLADGAECALGAPRVFGYFDGGTSTAGNRPATAPDFVSTDCGVPDGDGFIASVAVGAAGTIGYFGVTYDNLRPGTVTITDVTVGGTLVLFEAPAPEPSPSVTPTAEPATEPSQAPVAGGNSDEALPVTGFSWRGLLPAGVIALLAGGGLVAWALASKRRKRITFTA